MKAKKNVKILVIEDERAIRRKLVSILSNFGEVVDVGTKEEAFEQLINKDFEIAIIDLNLNGKVDGFKILEETKKRQVYSVVLSSSDREDYYKKAIIDYNAEGFYNKKDFIKSIDLIMKEYFLKQTFINHDLFTEKFITQDLALMDAIRSVMKYQAQGSAVLILGESGVGKTALAKVLHEAGGFEGNFVAINASAIPENLIESTLFGHLKGAFTGADTNKTGILAKANEGTLFIDEIASIPLNIQTKLLTCLDEKKFTPIGGEVNDPIYSNFNLITATCDDIIKKIAEKKFRSDLYNRIAQETILIPPLRNRPDDIPLLIKHFFKLSPKKKMITNEALNFLKEQKWNKNTRDLISIVKYCLSLKESVISTEELIKRCNNFSDDEESEQEVKSQVKLESILIDYDEIQKKGINQYLKKIKAELTHTVYKDHLKCDIEKALTYLHLKRTVFFEQLAYFKKVK